MNKALIVVAICGLLISTFIFVAYELGTSKGSHQEYLRGYTAGYTDGTHKASSNVTGGAAGFGPPPNFNVTSGGG